MSRAAKVMMVGNDMVIHMEFPLEVVEKLRALPEGEIQFGIQHLSQEGEEIFVLNGETIFRRALIQK